MKRLNLEKSFEYRKKVHNLIPGGAHTYSKGDDQFPYLSPAAISHGKGAYVWDLDGNKYLDCSMGLTSVSLGHAYEPVLERVRKELKKGVNFQRPSYLEAETAEKFLSLVPCHQMVKFCKNGSAATTAATKLARAYTGRKLIAFPGDHPFYSFDDWFIGKTACNKGIPEEIQNLSVTYKSTDLNTLTKLFEKFPGQIACVISEPEKNHPSQFINIDETIKITQKHGALFIQDEMVTGFKTGMPGTIARNKVMPDMATWGKGIANGFSFCALTGTKAVMELGGILNEGEEKVFLISTTHGGETHAMAAAIATIEEFLKHKVIDHMHSLGEYCSKTLQQVVDSKKCTSFVEVVHCNWMPSFIFKNKTGTADAKLRTLVLQEMIQRGVLFQGILIPSFSHKKSDVDFFAQCFGETLDIYLQALEMGVEKFLIGKECKPVFRKIT
ncbi:MAG: hypothetical protein A2X86_12345 [Bdellovibrionales bacterium GWA2_49_15]|nr:MAG: hypothetical protein A2X86_12345 [Bdellovibrionales bacterium GWA2_49_15]